MLGIDNYVLLEKKVWDLLPSIAASIGATKTAIVVARADIVASPAWCVPAESKHLVAFNYRRESNQQY